MSETDNPYRRARNAMGISQAELAIASGIDERTIRKLEGGLKVSVRTRREVGRALGIDPAFTDTTGPDRIVDAAELRPQDPEPTPFRRAVGAARSIGFISLLVGGMFLIFNSTNRLGDQISESYYRYIRLEIVSTRWSQTAGYLHSIETGDVALPGYTVHVSKPRQEADVSGVRQLVAVQLRPETCIRCSDGERLAILTDFTRKMLSNGVTKVVQTESVPRTLGTAGQLLPFL